MPLPPCALRPGTHRRPTTFLDGPHLAGGSVPDERLPATRPTPAPGIESWRSPSAALIGLALIAMLISGCYATRPSRGGGEGVETEARHVSPSDIALPPGYRIEAVATGLTYPTGVAEDDAGRPHVTESGYSYGEDWKAPRLVRVDSAGELTTIAQGSDNGPWNGVAFHSGRFYVAEGGERRGGRILAVAPEGGTEILVDTLPGQGDHHTNGPVVGPDGMVYFGQGTRTNSGVVGEDNHRFGWLARNAALHDIPCRDIRVAAGAWTTRNPLDPGNPGTVSTSAFAPFGVSHDSARTVQGRVPCNGAVMRVARAGGPIELVAWGFRNPFGLAFSADSTLWAVDNGYDERGSRPIWGAADHLWRVVPGAWYGWPDFDGGDPVDTPDRAPPGSAPPRRVLVEQPGRVPRPAASFAVHSSSNGLDFSRDTSFGHVGDAFVAQFGDLSPESGKTLAPAGFRVVRVDVRTGEIEDFAVNRGRKAGPASRSGGGGLERPVAVRFSRDGRTLWVVDFGIVAMGTDGPLPRPGTGVLWRITRTAEAGR